MKTTHRPLRDSSSLPGFTLIEMLISVSLVLLMMVMFAEIFSLASSSMTQQQAIARSAGAFLHDCAARGLPQANDAVTDPF
jgi:prepilin-type N-terminal cleavage/methylation domain-containing protein